MYRYCTVSGRKIKRFRAGRKRLSQPAQPVRSTGRVATDSGGSSGVRLIVRAFSVTEEDRVRNVVHGVADAADDCDSIADPLQSAPQQINGPLVAEGDVGAIEVTPDGGTVLVTHNIDLAPRVPIVENKPLARDLYKEVEIDHPIPDKFYTAVAEVLAYVYQLRGKEVSAA